jgi:hypothetical protein
MNNVSGHENAETYSVFIFAVLLFKKKRSQIKFEKLFMKIGFFFLGYF